LRRSRPAAVSASRLAACVFAWATTRRGALVCTGYALNDEVARRIAARGFAGLRFSHGFLVQRLIEEEQSIAALAAALEVTQQAVSKTVAELERLGYVRRRPAPHDARVRLVALTGRGRAAVEAARAERAAVVAELRERLGPRRVDAATRVLREVIEAHGGGAAVRARRVRPPA
jgi:DNA-binding MarR family transcriptional regulator